MTEKLATQNHRRALTQALDQWADADQRSQAVLAEQTAYNEALYKHLNGLYDGIIALKGLAFSVQFRGYNASVAARGEGYAFPPDRYRVGSVHGPAANGHRLQPYANTVHLHGVAEDADIEFMKVFVTKQTLQLATPAEVARTEAERAARLEAEAEQLESEI